MLGMCNLEENVLDMVADATLGIDKNALDMLICLGWSYSLVLRCFFFLIHSSLSLLQTSTFRLKVKERKKR